MVSYNFKTVEKKWQGAWKKAGIFKAIDGSKKKKYYVLEMLPYPSGAGLHVGHIRNYAIGDSFARYKRMRGFNVIYPMGWDSFGLPSENAAIKKGIHPTKSVEESIKGMKLRMNALGISYDWDREIETHDPEYYKWNQWLFLKFLEHGLAYKKKATGNWCPDCKTTLANEDVKAGRCWRCDAEVIQKEIDQWFVKVTKYADKLLLGLNKIDWSNRLKTLQKNWIGKSIGTEIYFKEAETGEQLKVFTTRPDTLFGVTFLVFAPEHPKVMEYVNGTKYEAQVKTFLKRTNKLNELERISKEKDGLFIGKYAINPATGDKIPIYIGNFVLMGYGTGMIIAVPAHDQRDFEFAKKYDIPIKVVINPSDYELNPEKMSRAFMGQGIMTNSGEFNKDTNTEATEKITDWLTKTKQGKKVTYYKIRDWNISRQRYWGTPIPIIYCDKCGAVPVPEKDLPIKLPTNVKFGKKGAVPLATNDNFVNAKCPKCGGKGKRETDTMTTFVDSAWYYLRYCDPKNSKQIFDKKKVKYWMPVDQYIGGIEHAVGHLMYSRFITKFLNKLGYLDFNEPFLKLLNQGMVNKNGIKMSKSKGNFVDPMNIIEEYGADTLRTYELFMAQPDSPIEWSEKELSGIHKFIIKVSEMNKLEESKDKTYIESVTQSKIKTITHELENLMMNKAIIELIDFANKIERTPSKYSIKIFLQMLAPFAPHVCEEVWSKLHQSKNFAVSQSKTAMREKGLIASSNWPEIDNKKIDLKAEEIQELLEKTAEDVQHICKIVGKKNPKKVCIYTIPVECKQYGACKEYLHKKFGADISVFAVNDPKKYDPYNKASKAKPKRPAIYLE
jgi:leucyl-tRNA synthetase